MAARGCGASRTVGGIYAEMHLGDHGYPLEHFLIDPPQIIDMQAMGLSAIGVKLIEVGGIWHVIDVVGANVKGGYSNVLDFVEEVRHLGLSRRLSPSLDFTKLSAGSRILLVHPRAYIDNYKSYSLPYDWSCPKDIPEHAEPFNEAMCIGWWRRDLTDWDREGDNGKVIRVMPAFEYNGYARPDQITPQYRHAIFASFPIHNLAVVRDQEGDKHEQPMSRAKKSGLRVDLVDE